MEREISKPQSNDIKPQVQPETGQPLSSSRIIYFGIFNVGHLIQENMRIAKAEQERNKNQQ